MVHTDLDRDLVSIATEQGEPHRTQNESVTSEEMALRGVAKASGAQMRLCSENSLEEGICWVAARFPTGQCQGKEDGLIPWLL